MQRMRKSSRGKNSGGLAGSWKSGQRNRIGTQHNIIHSCGFENHANVKPLRENQNNYFLEPIIAIPETINNSITFAAADFP
jgi:hypothetical protein